ncbi:MAG: PDZ domain-containing protein, partial [Firmicutes bacterium]|nr:PDZ domain-containing protein [Bacillota bacterium]
GHLGASPAYIKAEDGRVVGGFTLQKFWPIPLVALVAAGPAAGAGGIPMPEWWPLLRPETDVSNVLYQLVPVVAGLGYGDLAVARRPEEKSRLAATYLALYSLALLALALLAGRFGVLAPAAALFGPLGHELVIALGRRAESRARPLFVPPARGVMILDVLPGSAAWRAGLRAGDVVLEIDGVEVNDRATFRQMVAGGEPLEVALLSPLAGGVRRYRREFVPRRVPGEPLGVILVPEGDEGYYLEHRSRGLLERWAARWRRGPRR